MRAAASFILGFNFLVRLRQYIIRWSGRESRTGPLGLGLIGSVTRRPAIPLDLSERARDFGGIGLRIFIMGV